MALNVVQLMAPYNSGQAIPGLANAVIEGTGLDIDAAGIISLNGTEAATLGFVVSGAGAFPVLNWPLDGGTANSILLSDGAGSLSWSSNYVPTVPLGGGFPQTGAAVLPAGTTGQRPGAATEGYLRYNSDNGAWEYGDGAGWVDFGTVTDVSAIAPISSTGGATPIISLDNSGVTPGLYDYASVTVDATGRVTLAASGVAPNTTVIAPILNTGTAVEPIIGVSASSTSSAGVVQLNDTLTSTSVSQALTAAQGKILQDQINSLIVSGGLTNAGTFDASTGQMVTVSTFGASAGFVVGQDVPSPSGPIADYFVQIVVAGVYSPPGGGGPFDMIQGDWLFCNGTNWIQFNLAQRISYASETASGVIELATQAEVTAGTDATRAVVPAYLQGKMSDSISLNDSNSIASSAAVFAAANSAGSAIPCSVLLAKGDIIVATAAATPTALPVGSDGQILVADAACATGIKWVTATVGTVTEITAGTGLTGGTITTSGTIALANTTVTAGNYTNASITVDAQGRLTAASSGTAPVTSVTATSPIVSSGGATPDISLANSTVTPGSYTYASVTVNQKGLVTNATNGTPPIALNTVTAKGDLIAGTNPSSVTALPVGTDGQVLYANSACAEGLEWRSIPAATSYAIRPLDDISAGFDDNTSTFPLTIQSVAYTPNPSTNLVVFVGGVPQIEGAGNAYTVTGSQITFSDAPPSGASFYAFTVN